MQLWAEQQGKLSALMPRRGGNKKKSGDHEIFITKIFNHGISAISQKFLNPKIWNYTVFISLPKFVWYLFESDDFYLRAVFINTSSCQRGNP